MVKKRISDLVKEGRVLVSDGAWGTFLQAKGLAGGDCPELWCLDRPGDVLEVARSYVDAHADMIETNSFGGNTLKLEHYGLSARAAEINEAAAAISRKAAGDDCRVIASIGPTGKMLVMGNVTEQEMYDAFKVQAVALEKGGADAVCIETMGDPKEAVQAIRAVKENTGLEIICTFTFDLTPKGEYRTIVGTKPAQAAKAALEAGADVIGTNCGNGMERMKSIVADMRAACPDAPILVHANAGLPQYIDDIAVFPEGPEDMAAMVPELVKAGANIIGGCCGTTPAHIRAIREAVDKL